MTLPLAYLSASLVTSIGFPIFSTHTRKDRDWGAWGRGYLSAWVYRAGTGRVPPPRFVSSCCVEDNFFTLTLTFHCTGCQLIFMIMSHDASDSVFSMPRPSIQRYIAVVFGIRSNLEIGVSVVMASLLIVHPQ